MARGADAHNSVDMLCRESTCEKSQVLSHNKESKMKKLRDFDKSVPIINKFIQIEALKLAERHQ